MILGAIPSSGLVDNAPLLAKIVGMAIAALAAIHYTAQRTALKRAYLAALGGAPAKISKVPQAAALAATVALVASLSLVHGCSGVGGTGATSPIAGAGSAFLQCGKQDLTQLVGPQGWSLLATVKDDLSKDNYGQLIASLIGTIGSDAVGCAVVALEGLGKPEIATAPRAATPLETRARELIAKYDWKIAAPPPSSSAGSGK
jgi:hypothetical protein